MHYYKSNNEIMQYCIVSNDIALIMHYCALLKRSGLYDKFLVVNYKIILFCPFLFTVDFKALCPLPPFQNANEGS